MMIRIDQTDIFLPENLLHVLMLKNLRFVATKSFTTLQIDHFNMLKKKISSVYEVVDPK